MALKWNMFRSHKELLIKSLNCLRNEKCLHGVDCNQKTDSIRSPAEEAAPTLHSPWAVSSSCWAVSPPLRQKRRLFPEDPVGKSCPRLLPLTGQNIPNIRRDYKNKRRFKKQLSVQVHENYFFSSTFPVSDT